MVTPTPRLGWEADRYEWLHARRQGLGASDVAALLGFSTYTTPWQVWAEKTNAARPPDEMSEAAALGTALEPWLVGQAAVLLDRPVMRTEHQLYAHAEHPWRLCSPDAEAGPDTLVEAKTAGLLSRRPAKGWDDDAVPLGYEFQARWAMHVMDRMKVEMVALVAGHGVLHRSLVRDLSIEADLVAQVSEWWQHHVVEGNEPPVGELDNAMLSLVYPKPDGTEVDLDDTDADRLWLAYLAARDQERTSKAVKEGAGAALKRLLGDHEHGLLAGRVAVAWGTRKGPIDYKRLVADLIATTDIDVPDPELYRGPSSRSLSVKEPK